MYHKMAKIRSIFNSILFLFYLTDFVVCLYEDQIGKFDWKQSYIGLVKYASFDSVKRVVVATEENVLASLHLKNGQIAWRQDLEDPRVNRIELLYVDNEAVTVSGDGSNWYIRGWNLNSGFLEWEWTMYTENKPNAKWVVIKDQLVHIVPIVGSHLEVTSYQINTGKNRGVTTSIHAPWITDLRRCILAESYWTCISSNDSSGTVFSLKVEDNSNKVHNRHIDHLIGQAEGEVEIHPIKYPEPAFLLKRNDVYRLVLLQEDGQMKVIPFSLGENTIAITAGDRRQLIQLDLIETNRKLKIRSIDLDINTDEFQEVEYTSSLAIPKPITGICRGSGCRLLFSTKDGAVGLLQLPSGKLLWSREEALSRIIGVEFVELPVSEMDASIEREFNSAGGDVFGMLYKRLDSQIKQLLSFISGTKSDTSNNNLIRDEFGLHKLILVATSLGKIFALDTLTGAIIWSKYIDNMQPFEILGILKLLILEQRTARYPPFPAVCVLVGKDSVSGNGILYKFDPITGYSEKGIERLDYKIKQTMLLPYENENHLKSLLILSEDDKVYLYPSTSKELFRSKIKNTFLYTTDRIKTNLYGFALLEENGEFKAIPTWEFNYRHSKLVALSMKPANEKVHSQGRVLADRSVLYKYVNPNLIAVATLTNDTLHKHVLSVYLIDGVTGLILYSVSHKRANGPVHLVHSENWLIYTYFSERYRRVEVGAVELYEGSTQSNSTAFSSHAVSQLPHVETQAYILPATPLAITATLTERGITSKHVLVALSNGAVNEIPWGFLEPRGPNLSSGPEDGYIPYMPELFLPSEAVINYNNTLARVRGIQVSPARLESTSLVFIYGLDLFYTRVTPSKTFDLLKEDFDHWLIVMVLFGLTVASYVTKHFASRKALKQAWK